MQLTARERVVMELAVGGSTITPDLFEDAILGLAECELIEIADMVRVSGVNLVRGVKITLTEDGEAVWSNLLEYEAATKITSDAMRSATYLNEAMF